MEGTLFAVPMMNEGLWALAADLLASTLGEGVGDHMRFHLLSTTGPSCHDVQHLLQPKITVMHFRIISSPFRTLPATQ